MEEKMISQEKEEKTFNVRDIFLALRKHVVLMLIIVLAFSAVGAVYCFLLKPEYTVTQKLIYRCENKNYIDSSGKEVVANNTTSNINTMVSYGDTIIDLFDKGVVLDRANFYYDEYKNISSDSEAEKYISDLQAKAQGKLQDNTYTPPLTAEAQLKSIEKFRISTSRISSDDETTFAFNVSYTSPDRQEAEEKLSILVCAFALECKETKTLESGEETIKYFGEFEVIVSDLGVESVSPSANKSRILVLFVAGGVVAALVATLLINLFDNTVKNKKELESLVGAPTLSSVERWGD